MTQPINTITQVTQWNNPNQCCHLLTVWETENSWLRFESRHYISLTRISSRWSHAAEREWLNWDYARRGVTSDRRYKPISFSLVPVQFEHNSWPKLALQLYKKVAGSSICFVSYKYCSVNVSNYPPDLFNEILNQIRKLIEPTELVVRVIHCPRMHIVNKVVMTITKQHRLTSDQSP